jgi:hypothetical protein
MSSFTDELIVCPLPDGRRWRLYKEFDYHIGSEYSDYFVHVPLGFITDFASVPSLFWALIPPTGKYGAAALVHDYLYQSKMVSRMTADSIFYEAMGVLCVPQWKRISMWLAVRLFGWMGYSKNNLHRVTE